MANIARNDEPIICDTDAGSDVDDYLALAYLVNAAQNRFKLVSTTFGPVDLRAQAVSTLFQKMGAEIPVIPGVKKLMTPGKPIWLTGEESYLVDAQAPVKDNDMLESYLRYESFTLLAIGPLTNVATLIQHERFMQRCSQIVIMGGTITGEVLPLEHNFHCDPVATRAVIESPIPKIIIPLELTAPLPMIERHQEAFRKGRAEYVQLLSKWVDNWRKITKNTWTVQWPDRVERTPFVPPFYDSVHWHDAIAAAYIFHPDLFLTEDRRIRVSEDGGITLHEQGSAVKLCASVDPQITDIIAETILGANWQK
jgi:inosine-uridine nucleoside N-ribohydrolase